MAETWLAAWPAGAGAAFAAIAALASCVWVGGLARRDASLVDRFWPLFFLLAALVYARHAPALGARSAVALALVAAWALRLAAYLTRRNWGHGEDRRYRALRAQHDPGFAWKSLYLVFGLQAVLAWVIAWPVGVAITARAPLGPLDAAGVALAAFGVVFEAVADAQMARFRADPASRGQVMDRGLWGWSRHPNYFGEACVWWGVWALALAGGGAAAAWTVLSPLLITGLLLKVSGVAMLERDIAGRRPAYARYIRDVPAFVPRWPGRALRPRPDRAGR